MFPITADDAFRGVAFVDFGTVERNIEINRDNFRVAPGLGLRVAIPMLGPAPLAFDLLIPFRKPMAIRSGSSALHEHDQVVECVGRNKLFAVTAIKRTIVVINEVVMKMTDWQPIIDHFLQMSDPRKSTIVFHQLVHPRKHLQARNGVRHGIAVRA